MVEDFLQLLDKIITYLMIPKEIVKEFCLTLKFIIISMQFLK